MLSIHCLSVVLLILFRTFLRLRHNAARLIYQKKHNIGQPLIAQTRKSVLFERQSNCVERLNKVESPHDTCRVDGGADFQRVVALKLSSPVSQAPREVRMGALQPRGLLQRDRTIYKIEVLDRMRRPLMSQVDDMLKDSQTRVYEAPIRKDLVDVNTFGVDDAPHVSGADDVNPEVVPGMVIGFVRVTMSPSSMLENKRHRILIGTLIAGFFLLISGVVGYILGRGLTRPLAQTMSAIRRIREGNYDIDLKVTAGGEIGELQGTIIQMVEGLDAYKKDLEGIVQARTRALAEARDDAIKSDEEKRRLIRKVNSIVEEERKNIAVEIHDHLNATLIVIRLAAKRIGDLASKKSIEHMDEIKLRAESVIEHTSSLYGMARGIVKRLRPEVIDTLGLREGVEEMVRHYDAIHPECHFSVEAVGDFAGLNSELAISAYRLIQEAMSNVVKHSQATEATVLLEVCPDKSRLRIRIKDNGKGFNPAAANTGIGLIGMKERVHGVGGVLKITSEPGAETVIQVDLPVPRIESETAPEVGAAGEGPARD